DKDFMGDEAFLQADGHNTFTEIYYALIYNTPAAIIISIVSVVLLVLFESKLFKNIALFRYVPAALFVIIVGVILNLFFSGSEGIAALAGEHMVQLPVAASASEFVGFLTFPTFGEFGNPVVWQVALSIAMVASIETLLS